MKTKIVGLIFIFFLSLTLISSNSASASALLVQTGDVWQGSTAVQPYTALTDAGISYTQISHANFSSTNLSGYQFLYLVGQAEESSAYVANIIPSMSKVNDYVAAGGLALIHFADWEMDSVINNIGPSGVSRTQYYTNIANIPSGKETDSLFTGLTSADLSDWNYTAHGFLQGLPVGANVLVTNENGDPIYARYSIGLGQVWITTMASEWEGANPLFLTNELSLATQYTPVPLPATFLFFGTGLIGIGGLAIKRRLGKK